MSRSRVDSIEPLEQAHGGWKSSGTLGMRLQRAAFPTAPVECLCAPRRGFGHQFPHVSNFDQTQMSFPLHVVFIAHMLLLYACKVLFTHRRSNIL